MSQIDAPRTALIAVALPLYTTLERAEEGVDRWMNLVVAAGLELRAAAPQPRDAEPTLHWRKWNEIEQPDGMTILDPDGFRHGKPEEVTYGEFLRRRMECTLADRRDIQGWTGAAPQPRDDLRAALDDLRAAVELCDQRVHDSWGRNGMADFYTFRAADWNRVLAVARGHLSEAALRELDKGRAQPSAATRPTCSHFPGQTECDWCRATPADSLDALRALLALIGDRDIPIEDGSGFPSFLRFGKGGGLTFDSGTGRPLGPGEVGVSGKSGPSLEDLLERLNKSGVKVSLVPVDLTKYERIG